MCDPCDLKEMIQKLRYRKDDAEGGEDHSDCCDQCSCKAFLFVSDVGRTVDSDRSRSGLCDDGDVHHLIVGNPFLLLYAGAFDQCDHGVSAAEGKQANLRKGQKEIK